MASALKFNPTANKCNSMLIQGPLYIDESVKHLNTGLISSSGRLKHSIGKKFEWVLFKTI